LYLLAPLIKKDLMVYQAKYCANNT